jgi:hypothetical protein
LDFHRLQHTHNSLEYFFLVFPILYLTVICFGIINYNKIRGSLYLKLFLIFITYSLITEILGYIFGVIFKRNSFFIYNTWNFINNYFFFFFFLGILGNGLKKQLLKFLILSYTVLSIIDLLFFTSFVENSMNVNIIIGSIIIVIAVLMYLTNLLENDTILYFKNSMFFWISLGVLLFNIGFVPVFVVAEFIEYKGAYRYISFALNILMNLIFIIGFIVSKKEYNFQNIK